MNRSSYSQYVWDVIFYSQDFLLKVISLQVFLWKSTFSLSLTLFCSHKHFINILLSFSIFDKFRIPIPRLYMKAILEIIWYCIMAVNLSISQCWSSKFLVLFNHTCLYLVPLHIQLHSEIQSNAVAILWHLITFLHAFNIRFSFTSLLMAISPKTKICQQWIIKTRYRKHMLNTIHISVNMCIVTMVQGKLK